MSLIVFSTGTLLCLVSLSFSVASAESDAGDGTAVADDGVVHLTALNFHETVVSANQEDFFILFYAPWCGHCKAIKPLFEEADAMISRAAADAKTKRNAARFVLVDAVAETLLATAYNVRTYPTFMYSVGGSMFRYDGPRDVDSFVFFARFLSVGRQIGTFAPLLTVSDHIADVQRQAPTRVLSLLSSGCLHHNNKSLRVECLHIVNAVLTNGKAHLAVLSPDFSDPQRVYHNISTAFQKASAGPHGEKLVTLSSMFEDSGIIPFQGSWDVSYDPHIAPAVKPVASEDDARSEILATLWGHLPRFSAEAVSFINRYSLLPVDDGDSAAIRAAVDRDGGSGALAFLFVNTVEERAAGSRLMRGIAQVRYRLQNSTEAREEGLRMVTFFSSLISPDLMNQLAITRVPAFTLYLPQNELSCVLEVHGGLFSSAPDDAASIQELLLVDIQNLINDVDDGKYSACTPTTFAARLALITTYLAPPIDRLLRHSYLLGNLEIVMIEAMFLIVLVVIPLTVCQGASAGQGDDAIMAAAREDERRKLQLEMMARRKAEPSAAAAKED